MSVGAPALERGATFRTPTLKHWIGLIVGGLVFGLLAGYLGTSGHATRILALTVVFLPVAIWKRPQIAPAVLLAAAILIEQNGQIPTIPITQKIPLFQGIGPGHLQGADMLLLMIVIICVLKRHELGLNPWPRSHITIAMYGIVAGIALAVGLGQLHHGALRVSLMECRPYVYVVVSYFLTSILITSRKAVRMLLWAFVLSVGFKALQGLYVWVGHRHMYPKPEAYIGHEASYFFVIFIVLVLALWVCHKPDRLRTVATWLLPIVLFAAVINHRRVVWEMLGVALLCFGVVVYHALPRRRRLLGKSVVAILLASAVYFPVMWNSTGSLAMPAQSIKSQIHPSVRDASSDLYRVQENANLQHNIQQGGLLGRGFGVKIDYALPIADISTIDPLITYIPHDDVLDVLMRMGLLGGISMWFLIGAGIITGSRLAKSRDRETVVIGLVVSGAMVAWAFMAAEDQGFYMFRLAFVSGCVLGLAEAARRLQRTRATAGTGR
jgi:hypothetical protein